jgi:hypothetical protein
MPHQPPAKPAREIEPDAALNGGSAADKSQLAALSEHVTPDCFVDYPRWCFSDVLKWDERASSIRRRQLSSERALHHAAYHRLSNLTGRMGGET